MTEDNCLVIVLGSADEITKPKVDTSELLVWSPISTHTEASPERGLVISCCTPLTEQKIENKHRLSLIRGATVTDYFEVVMDLKHIFTGGDRGERFCEG